MRMAMNIPGDGEGVAAFLVQQDAPGQQGAHDV